MKTLKHLLTALLLMVATVAMAHDFEVGGIYYNILSEEEKTVEVTYRGDSYGSYLDEYTGSVDIPSSVISNGITYAVTSIGAFAFWDCPGLKSVTIPNSVTSIGGCAFYGCSGLTSVTIPNSVTSIGETAFGYCSGLTSVTIPNSVTSIGESAFGYCSGLTSVTIPNSVTSIGECAFYGCSGLTSVTIPNSVTSIGDYAFEGCTGLTSVTIPDSVTSIGDEAFSGCFGLKEVHISDLASWCNIDFNDYGSNPLYYAHNLYLNGELVTELVIPDGVSEIKNYAFWVCSGLTSVTIGNSVTSIGYSAFDGCSGLTSVTIPNSVTSIGDYAFSGCSGLTSVTIPNSVTSIGNGAFEDCTGLTSVTIPNSVTSIGGWAFSGCSGLKEVHISDLASWCNIDFNDYGSNPLYYAHNLYLNGELVTELVIPDGVSKIKNFAFYDCSGLTSITIPNSVTSIGYRAFDGCSGLKEVHISDLASWCNIDFDGYESNPLYCAHNLYLNGELVTELVIPDGVSAIKNFAFFGCSELMRVDIVDGVKSIWYNAFAFCSNLEELYISNTIESIAYYAFEGCTNILEIKVGSKNAITCSENIFSEDVYNNALLCVPEGRKSAYEKTAPWNRFYIVETDYTDINGVKEQIAENNTVYDLQGRKVENPTNGIYIVNGKKVFVK